MIAELLVLAAVALPLGAYILSERRLLRVMDEAAAARSAAAYYKGLFEGERGRREAAERQAAHGVALEPAAREVVPTEPASEEIARDIGKPFSEDTLQRGIEDLRRQFAQAGLKPTDAELRAEALLMLQTPEADEPT